MATKGAKKSLSQRSPPARRNKAPLRQRGGTEPAESAVAAALGSSPVETIQNNLVIKIGELKSYQADNFKTIEAEINDAKISDSAKNSLKNTLKAMKNALFGRDIDGIKSDLKQMKQSEPDADALTNLENRILKTYQQYSDMQEDENFQKAFAELKTLVAEVKNKLPSRNAGTPLWTSLNYTNDGVKFQLGEKFQFDTIIGKIHDLVNPKGGSIKSKDKVVEANVNGAEFKFDLGGLSDAATRMALVYISAATVGAKDDASALSTQYRKIANEIVPALKSVKK
jgi:hypothetical protein